VLVVLNRGGTQGRAYLMFENVCASSLVAL
jgi:hypothetical protein